MTWLGVWLVGVGLADLVRSSPRPQVRRWAVGVGLVATAGLGALGGLLAPTDLVVGLGAALALLLWVRWSQQALLTGTGHVPALGALALGAVWLVALSGWSSDAGGLLGRWLRWADLPAVGANADPGQVLLVAGLLLANLATGNIIVRLVLVSVGALRPADRTSDPGAEPAEQLRGGRLLGPMERVLIIGLGLAGQVTAAGLVIAAKGLIRFPELQSKRSDHESVEGAGIDQVTEYFLVGSFVSWLLALGSLVLTR
ncbi:hypothetical protein [Phycicoccus avicenniae]|uniref:hypothetical protein n=1 Tax=Phycicoccus avicenniae TaxID=2828860 RepID=UPI003D274D6F